MPGSGDCATFESVWNSKKKNSHCSAPAWGGSQKIGKCEKLRKNCGKLRKIAENCEKLRNCGKLRKIADLNFPPPWLTPCGFVDLCACLKRMVAKVIQEGDFAELGAHLTVSKLSGELVRRLGLRAAQPLAFLASDLLARHNIFSTNLDMAVLACFFHHMKSSNNRNSQCCFCKYPAYCTLLLVLHEQRF